jgi:type IV secretion system protein TrbL
MYSDTQILTKTLETLSEEFFKIPENLKGTAFWLLLTLTIIDFGMLIFKVDEIDWIKTLCRKAFKIGFLYWIIDKYQYLLTEIQKGFVKIGVESTGFFDGELLKNPSNLLTEIFNMTTPLYDNAALFTKTGLMYWVIILVMYFCAIAIAFQVFVVWLEFYALTGITIIFIPFAALDKTSFITEKAFSVILSMGIKVMTLALTLGASYKILSKISIPENMGLLPALHVLSIIMSIMYLIWRTPGLAASLLTGNPNLSSGDMAGFIKSGANAGAAAVGGAIGAMAGSGKNFINFGLGVSGKESLGDISKGGKAHTAGQRLSSMMSGLSRSNNSTSAPGGKENSESYQNSKKSD